MKNLIKNYEKACNKYVEAFAKLYEIDFDYWVSGKIGEIAFFGDYNFTFNEIRIAVDLDIKEFSILAQWCDLTVYTKCKINLETYFKRRRDYFADKPNDCGYDFKDYHIMLLNEMIND